jgi:hypothetical protein
MSEVSNMICVGMILASKKRKPDSLFVVTHLYQREYANGNVADRATGLIIRKKRNTEPWLENRPHGAPAPGIDGSELRDLDVRSLEKMFPHVWFDPVVPEPEEDK